MDVKEGHKGFIVHLRDGRTIKEDEVIGGVTHDWKEIKKISNNLQDVTAIQIKRGEVYHTLSVDGKNLELLQLKSNVLNMMTGEDNLVERVLGFIIKDEKGAPAYAIKMRIGEKTGGTKLTLEKKTEKGWILL
jgi:hypothetical protein